MQAKTPGVGGSKRGWVRTLGAAAVGASLLLGAAYVHAVGYGKLSVVTVYGASYRDATVQLRYCQPHGTIDASSDTSRYLLTAVADRHGGG